MHKNVIEEEKFGPILHIFGQSAWHDDSYIVGNKDALTRLRDAISKALEEGAAATNSFTNDGEGYTTIVKVVDDKFAWEKLLLPYTDETASQKESEIAVGPWSLISNEEYEKLKEWRIEKGKDY